MTESRRYANFNILSKLRKTGDFSDCLVELDETSSYCLHSFVLSSCSEFFRESIANFQPDEAKRMILYFKNLEAYPRKFQRDLFETLLSMIYNDDVACVSADTIIPLSIMADQLLIVHFDDVVIDYLQFSKETKVTQITILQQELFEIAPQALRQMPKRFHDGILATACSFLTTNTYWDRTVRQEVIDKFALNLERKHFLGIVKLIEGNRENFPIIAKTTQFMHKWIDTHTGQLIRNDILVLEKVLPISSSNAFSVLLLYDQYDMKSGIEKCCKVVCDVLRDLQTVKNNMPSLVRYSCAVLSQILSSKNVLINCVKQADELYSLVNNILQAKKQSAITKNQEGVDGLDVPIEYVDDYVCLWSHISLSALSDSVSLLFMKNELVPDSLKIKLGIVRIEAMINNPAKK